jgi:hypothetical protein
MISVVSSTVRSTGRVDHQRPFAQNLGTDEAVEAVAHVVDEPVDGQPFEHRFGWVLRHSRHACESLSEAGRCAGIQQQHVFAVGDQQVAVPGQVVVTFESC